MAGDLGPGGTGGVGDAVGGGGPVGRILAIILGPGGGPRGIVFK